MLREWFRQQRHRHIWYAAIAFLIAFVAFGSLEHLFGGSAQWGAIEGDHFFLSTKFGPRVEVSAFAYWLSVCALWLTRLAGGWLLVVVIASSIRSSRVHP